MVYGDEFNIVNTYHNISTVLPIDNLEITTRGQIMVVVF